MFHRLRLIEAFEKIACPEEWEWFGPMVARGVMHIGADGWPLFENHRLRAYQIVLARLEGEVLQKLRAGEWIAEGISHQYGPKLVQIETSLWEYLQIENRLEEASGAGFHFLALTLTEISEPRSTTPLAEQPRLRRQLTNWIQTEIAKSSGPVRKADVEREARRAFEGVVISPNMFREAWRDADVPHHSKHRGRPKAKGSDL